MPLLQICLNSVAKLFLPIFVLGNIAQSTVRNLHKIIQAELRWERHIRLHENDKANQGIIFGEII